MVWLGIESIGADLSMHPDKSNVQAGKKVPANNAVNDLIDEIDSLLADFDEPKSTTLNRTSAKRKQWAVKLTTQGMISLS